MKPGSVLKLDIFDLNHHTSNEQLLFYRYETRSLFRLLTIGIANYFRGLFKSATEINKLSNARKLNAYSIWFFAQSGNNYHALKNVMELTPGSCIFSMDKFGISLPKLVPYLLSFPFIFFLLFKKKNLSSYRRKVLFYRFNNYISVYGYYIYFKWLLKNKQPKLIVLANDHELKSRTLKHVCKKYNIATAYIQHASVSEHNPPLDFTYAFLEGEDSYIKYSTGKTVESKVFFGGCPKMDRSLQLKNTSSLAARIGICTNEIDSLDKTAEILQLCKKLSFREIHLRPHPADERWKKWQELASVYQCIFSNSKMVNAFSFLEKVDAIIACESSIHLEAALRNVFPVYYNLQEKIVYHDVYGYYANKLIPKMHQDIDELEQTLVKLRQNKPDIRKSAKFYNFLIDTPFDGKAGEIIALTLNSFLTNNILVNWIAHPQFNNCFIPREIHETE